MINRLQHEHPDGLLSTAKQQYQGLGRRILQTATASGGGGATLTEANTRPISIKLDFSSLDEATAPQYAACFTAGAWFRRGFPSPQTPPEDGVATCVRGTPSETSLAGQDCWGKCLAADVITPEKKALLVAVITKIVTEDLTPLLRVQPVQGPLLFDDNEGVHQRALLSKGYTPYRACAVDCTVLSGVAVDRLHRMVERGQANERVYFNLGMLSMDAGDKAEAERWLRTAVDLKPDFRSALFNLALLLSEIPRRELESVPLLHQLLQHHPDHIKGLILLGDLYVNQLSDLDAAERCYRRILELDGRNVQGLHNLCVVMVERGNLLEARDCLVKARDLAPHEKYIRDHLDIVRKKMEEVVEMRKRSEDRTVNP